MTISSRINKVSYKGTGGRRTWPITFPVLSASHVQLVITDAENNDTKVTTGYEVDLTTNIVTYPVAGAMLPAGKTLTLMRIVPLIQETDLENNGPMEAEVLEAAYDYLMMAIQQVSEKVDRAIVGPASNTGAPQEVYADLLNASAAAKEAAREAATSEEYAREVLAAIDTLAEQYKTDIQQLKTLVVRTVGIGADETGYSMYDSATTTLTIYVPQGERGPKGDFGTMSVGTISTLTPGSVATVVNVGTADTAILNFGIPQGATGERGEQGPAATIAIGAVRSVDPAENLTITNSGTPQNAIFNFNIPRASDGLKGPQGDRGEDGIAPVGISLGSFEFNAENGHLQFAYYDSGLGDENINMAGHFDNNGHVILEITEV